jgi:branched-chain amino acid transport system ATP-binding protein
MNPQETMELSSFIVHIKERYNLTVFMIEHHMDLVMAMPTATMFWISGSSSHRNAREIQSNQRFIDAYLGWPKMLKISI